MIYTFVSLIVLAVAGIGYLVFKYYKPSFKKSSTKNIGGIKGEEFWLNLIKDNPKNPYPYKKLGEWYAEHDQIDFAVKTFKYALKLDPKDGNVRKKLVELNK